jgi:hypothetical protein
MVSFGLYLSLYYHFSQKVQKTHQKLKQIISLFFTTLATTTRTTTTTQMTPAELIALAEKHNILIPNAFDKDSFEETRGWTDEKWERFIQYYGYDENDDAIIESIEYFEEQDEEEEEEKEFKIIKVIVDPERIWNCFDSCKRDWVAGILIKGFPFDNIMVKGLTDRQLEVLGRFVSRCKKSD